MLGLPDWPLSSKQDDDSSDDEGAEEFSYGERSCLVGLKGHLNMDNGGSLGALGFIFRDFPEAF